MSNLQRSQSPRSMIGTRTANVLSGVGNAANVSAMVARNLRSKTPNATLNQSLNHTSSSYSNTTMNFTASRTLSTPPVINASHYTPSYGDRTQAKIRIHGDVFATKDFQDTTSDVPSANNDDSFLSALRDSYIRTATKSPERTLRASRVGPSLQSSGTFSPRSRSQLSPRSSPVKVAEYSAYRSAVAVGNRPTLAPGAGVSANVNEGKRSISSAANAYYNAVSQARYGTMGGRIDSANHSPSRRAHSSPKRVASHALQATETFQGTRSVLASEFSDATYRDTAHSLEYTANTNANTGLLYASPSKQAFDRALFESTILTSPRPHLQSRPRSASYNASFVQTQGTTTTAAEVPPLDPVASATQASIAASIAAGKIPAATVPSRSSSRGVILQKRTNPAVQQSEGIEAAIRATQHVRATLTHNRANHANHANHATSTTRSVGVHAPAPVPGATAPSDYDGTAPHRPYASESVSGIVTPATAFFAPDSTVSVSRPDLGASLRPPMDTTTATATHAMHSFGATARYAPNAADSFIDAATNILLQNPPPPSSPYAGSLMIQHSLEKITKELHRAKPPRIVPGAPSNDSQKDKPVVQRSLSPKLKMQSASGSTGASPSRMDATRNLSFSQSFADGIPSGTFSATDASSMMRGQHLNLSQVSTLVTNNFAQSQHLQRTAHPQPTSPNRLPLSPRVEATGATAAFLPGGGGGLGGVATAARQAAHQASMLSTRIKKHTEQNDKLLQETQRRLRTPSSASAANATSTATAAAAAAAVAANAVPLPAPSTFQPMSWNSAPASPPQIPGAAAAAAKASRPLRPATAPATNHPLPPAAAAASRATMASVEHEQTNEPMDASFASNASSLPAFSLSDLASGDISQWVNSTPAPALGTSTNNFANSSLNRSSNVLNQIQSALEASYKFRADVGNYLSKSGVALNTQNLSISVNGLTKAPPVIASPHRSNSPLANFRHIATVTHMQEPKASAEGPSGGTGTLFCK